MPATTFKALSGQMPALQADETLRLAKAEWFPYLSDTDRQDVLDAAGGTQAEMSGWDSEGLKAAAEILGTKKKAKGMRHED